MGTNEQIAQSLIAKRSGRLQPPPGMTIEQEQRWEQSIEDQRKAKLASMTPDAPTTTSMKAIGSPAMEAPATVGEPEYAKPKEEATGEDVARAGLDVAGAFPVIGEAADLTTMGLDLRKGDYPAAAISGAAVLLPFVSAGLMKRAMSKSLQKAAKSTKGHSADTLRKNLGTIDKEVTRRIEAIDFNLRSGKITPAEAKTYKSQVESRAQEAVGKAETKYKQGRLGVKSPATRRAEHEAMNAARVAEGKAPIPYKDAPAYGTGGAAEGSLSQPFQGGETIITGRKGARSASVEDTLRTETFQDIQTGNTRKPTKGELAQIEEHGQIITPDPNAPHVTVVDDAGNVLAGRRTYKQRTLSMDEPYAEETGEAIMGMPLTREATKGVGQGTIGMSDSLVDSLSQLSFKEFPPGKTTRRTFGGDPSKYFDTLTSDQQKQVLAKAKILPGLSRDIARHEKTVEEAAQRASTSTPSASPAGSARVRKRVSAQREAALAEQQKASATKSAQKAAKKQSQRSFNDDEIAFLSSIDDDVKRDEARKMLLAARAQGTTVTRNQKGEFIFKSEPSAAPKKAAPKQAPKREVQTYEDWKTQKKPRAAEKPKDLPKAKAVQGGEKAKPVRPEIKRTDVGISPAERSAITAERSALFRKENKTPADRARMKELIKSLATGKKAPVKRADVGGQSASALDRSSISPRFGLEDVRDKGLTGPPVVHDLGPLTENDRYTLERISLPVEPESYNEVHLRQLRDEYVAYGYDDFDNMAERGLSRGEGSGYGDPDELGQLMETKRRKIQREMSGPTQVLPPNQGPMTNEDYRQVERLLRGKSGGETSELLLEMRSKFSPETGRIDGRSITNPKTREKLRMLRDEMAFAGREDFQRPNYFYTWKDRLDSLDF